MAEQDVPYTRKLSGEEALERYIMIMKERLNYFPKPGVPFKLQIGEQKIQIQIDAVDCWCRGPKKPHVHFRIDLSRNVQLFRPHFNQSITIEKRRKNLYALM